MKRKQLLPKDLAARAEKVDPKKVEAEVLQIISAKPAALSPSNPRFVPNFGQILQAGSILPPDTWRQLQAEREILAREAQLNQQFYASDLQRQQQQNRM